jgi:DNA polymerase-3 subunit epsilon
MNVLDGPLIFVDIETTGMSFARDRVIEVAAIKVINGKVIDSFESLVDPEAELPGFISELTGITREDLKTAPSFYAIADELFSIMDAAVFVAHNARFDYGFLKQEFKRLGRKFNPSLLCTVKLSRSLYPEARGHKLQDLIDRCDIKTNARHRAYDDANAMWQFIQHARYRFPAPLIESALKQQINSPSLPKNLSVDIVKNLPQEPGIYIFQDINNSPLYIGKSVNIKKRVLSHFSADHEYENEFKISQQVNHVETIVTAGELEALLLESKLIKDLQPLFNRQLRRRQKMTIARQALNTNGYLYLSIEDTKQIEPDNISDILSVYSTKTKARELIDQIIKDFGLCPKLMGFEKGKSSCFMYQIKKCSGACVGKELPAVYNARLLRAFENRRLVEWPYKTPVIIEEKNDRDEIRSIVVDKWCVIADITQQPDCDPVINFENSMFDLDTYKILRSYLVSKSHKLVIKPISIASIKAFAF